MVFQHLLGFSEVFKLTAFFKNSDKAMPVSTWLRSRHAVLLYALTKVVLLKM